jgi:glyoxylase-like metal-dependent hydrolase (beta-lactamase superfamily II)
MVASLQFGLGSEYDCHVYAIRCPEGLVLIDSGSGWQMERMMGAIRTEFPGEQIQGVLLTHAHADHGGGASRLQKETGCAVYSPPECAEAIRTGDEEFNGLREARELGIYPADMRLTPCDSVESYSDGRPLRIAGQTFLPIHVRGHSDDAYCIFSEVDGRRTLFSGDVVFYGAVLGVINRHDSGMNGYRADLPKLAELDVEALLPGHGLFTLRGGQRHIDLAIEQTRRGIVPRQIGQGDLIF